jgi:hypothetical protein
MSKLTALAIALLTVISIAPESQAMSTNASPIAVKQPAGDLQAQLIIKIGGNSDRPYYGDDRRREDDYYRRLEQEREAERRRREFYAQRRHDRRRYHREREEYRGDYHREYRDDYRHGR